MLFKWLVRVEFAVSPSLPKLDFQASELLQNLVDALATSGDRATCRCGERGWRVLYRSRRVDRVSRSRHRHSGFHTTLPVRRFRPGEAGPTLLRCGRYGPEARAGWLAGWRHVPDA